MLGLQRGTGRKRPGPGRVIIPWTVLFSGFTARTTGSCYKQSGKRRNPGSCPPSPLLGTVGWGPRLCSLPRPPHDWPLVWARGGEGSYRVCPAPAPRSPQGGRGSSQAGLLALLGLRAESEVSSCQGERCGGLESTHAECPAGKTLGMGTAGATGAPHSGTGDTFRPGSI